MLKKILDALPFDGSKTSLGAILAGLGIGSDLAGVDFAALIQLVLLEPTKTGIALAVVGIAHKLLKAKAEKRGLPVPNL